MSSFSRSLARWLASRSANRTVRASFDTGVRMTSPLEGLLRVLAFSSSGKVETKMKGTSGRFSLTRPRAAPPSNDGKPWLARTRSGQ